MKKASMAFVLFFGLVAQAADYWWRGTDATRCSWSDAGIWALDAEGTAATAAPGAEDALRGGTTPQTMAFDFAGESFSLGSWNWDRANVAHDVLLENGTLAVTGSRMSLVSGRFTIGRGGILSIGSNAVWLGGGTEDGGNPSSTPFEYVIGNGGHLAFHGKLRAQWMTFTVNAGGSFLFGSDARYANGNRKLANTYEIYGTAEFPGGVQKFDNSWSVLPTFNLHPGGLLVAGGPFRKANNWAHRFNLAGGELRATADCSFEVEAGRALFKEDSETTLCAYAEGTTLNVGNFTLEGACGIVCTGEGNIVLPDVPAALEMRNAGTVTFIDRTQTAMARLFVGEGHTFALPVENFSLANLMDLKGTIHLGAPGWTVSGVAASAALTGTVTVDPLKFAGGDTLVETPSAALRRCVMAGAEAAGLSCVEDGAVVRVAVDEVPTFVGAVSGDLGLLANWTKTQTVPQGGVVAIAGAADLTASAPSFERINILDGGTLRCADGVRLPVLEVREGARLFVAQGARVELQNEVVLKVSDPARPPAIEISAEGVLTMDAAVYFPAFSIVNNGGQLVRTTSAPQAFRWAGGTLGLATALAHWKDEGGFAVTRLPCGQDSFYCSGDFSLDLAGYAWKIAEWAAPNDWNNHYLDVTNGVLTFSGKVETHSGTWTVRSGAVVRFDRGARFLAANNTGASLTVKVLNGGLFDFAGQMSSYFAAFEIGEGGRAVFDYERWGASSGSAQKGNTITVTAGGRAEFPHGFVWSQGGYTAASYRAGLVSTGGELLLGGDIARSTDGRMQFSVDITGGKVHVLSNLTVTADSARLAGTVEFAVSNAASFRLSNFTLDAAAGIVKSGAGVLILDRLPAALTVREGRIGFYAANVPLELPAATTFAEGGIILLGANGLTASALPEQASFEVDLQSIVFGVPIVSTADAQLLARMERDVARQLAGRPYAVTAEQGALVVRELSPYTFTGAVSTDLAEGANWLGGVVPTGQDVVIQKDAAVRDTLPSFSSMTVEGGATLSVAGTVELPRLVLSLDGTVEIAAGAVVSAGPIAGVAVADRVPALTVRENATLTVEAGQKFGNLRLSLAEGSLLTTASDGPIVFGYAGADETTYFALAATNATITARNAAKVENAARLDFVVPAPRGQVVVLGDIRLQGTTLTYNETDGFAFGLNNPETMPFTVVFDGTDVDFGAETVIAGGAHIVCTNDAAMTRRRHPQSGSAAPDYNLVIQDLARLTLVAGGTLNAGITDVNYQWGEYTREVGTIVLKPSQDNHPGIVVARGGGGYWYKVNGGMGSHPGSIRFEDGTMESYRGYWWGWNNRAQIFYNLGAVDIPAGAVCHLRGTVQSQQRVHESSPGSTERAEEMFVELQSPFAGAGDLLVENGRSDLVYEPILQSAHSTNTGRLMVTEAEEGKKPSVLHIQDGAAWAGTVVANGRIDLVDTVTGPALTHAAPVSVTFGALELCADFPVKVWRTAEGTLTNDLLNVGAYLNNGGRLVLDVAEGVSVSPAEKIVLGTCGAGSALPRLKGPWAAKTLPRAGDDGNVLLVVQPSFGFRLLVR